MTDEESPPLFAGEPERCALCGDRVKPAILAELERRKAVVV